MRRFYTFFLYFLIPFLLVRLYWKSRLLASYRQRIRERFALKKEALPVDIWIHAVSLGEVVAATSLVELLLNRSRRILITTMTPTGSERVNLHFGNRVQHQYLPYDLPIIFNRFFNQYKPKLGLIMETELWPNMIVQSQRNTIPLLLVNARISDKANKQYQKVKFFFKPLLQHFSLIGAQSEEDAKRFIAMGATSSIVSVMGNLKFDLQTHYSNSEFYQQVQMMWGSERTVVIAASTHEGEEKQLLNHLQRLKEDIPDVLLLIAPRHPERFQTVYDYSLNHGFKTGLRSQPESINEGVEVIILDSLGELLGFYQISHYAFVGGSLVPIGGHNVLEPIAMGTPVLTGPYIHNAKAICLELSSAGALQIAENAGELISTIIALHHNKEQSLKQVNKAKEILNANQGCASRYLEKIEQYLN